MVDFTEPTFVAALLPFVPLLKFLFYSSEGGTPVLPFTWQRRLFIAAGRFESGTLDPFSCGNTCTASLRRLDRYRK
jgi:hypothetical protein